MINSEHLEIIDDVPIFAQNNLREEFTLDKLQRIVDVNNARIAMEELPPIVVGHDDPFEEEVNKPCLGFIQQFKLGIRNGINTIFARLAVFKNELETINKYPRRSIEVGSESLLVPRLALLGGSEPALDLGLLIYQKNKNVNTEQLLKYSKDKITVETINTYNKEESMITDDFEKNVLDVLCKTDMYQYVKEQMDKTEKEEYEESDQEKDGMEEEKSAEAGEKEEVKEDKSEAKAEEDTSNDKNESQDDVLKEEDDEDKDEYKKYQSEITELKLKFQKSEREKNLIRLASEGYDFDLDVELADCEEMTDAQFAKHRERIKRFSKMAPVNLRKFSVKTLDIGGISNTEDTTAKAEAIKDYALKNNIKYRDAEKILTGK